MHRVDVQFLRAISQIALIMALEYFLAGIFWGGMVEHTFEELVYCMFTISFGYGFLQYMIDRFDRKKEQRL